MSVVIGWDIGGAHLKAAKVVNGRVEATAQAATPLWLGLDTLHAAFDALKGQLGGAGAHAVTMTGELCDAFASRREGVAGLAAIAVRHLAPAPARFYAGAAGFVGAADVEAHAAAIASANWRATAEVVGLRLRDALLVDVGSTTADLVPVAAGRVAAVGSDDAGRLAAGELVYAGLSRSFVMAMASRAPFRGVWTPLMNEFFASSADVYRILGVLPDGADRMATADGREKTAAASCARLARMVGREADEAEVSDWRALARWFAEAQTRDICDAAFLRLSRGDLPAGAPVVAAGIGESIAAEVARRLDRPSRTFASLVGAPAGASHCAPAVAVAILAAASLDACP